MPDEEELLAWAHKHNVPGTFEELCQNEVRARLGGGASSQDRLGGGANRRGYKTGWGGGATG